VLIKNHLELSVKEYCDSLEKEFRLLKKRVVIDSSMPEHVQMFNIMSLRHHRTKNFSIPALFMPRLLAITTFPGFVYVFNNNYFPHFLENYFAEVKIKNDHMIDKMEDRVKHAFNKYEDVLIM
jgi:hypothetical protein